MVAQSPSVQLDDTREKLLIAAHGQFAERGFYGASIAQIAGEVGLTKQALLYHFKRKEDLYGEVLRRISVRMLEMAKAELKPDGPPEQQFEGMIFGIYRAATSNPLDTRILMRELLDNQRREAPKEEWYFKPFIERIVHQLDQIDGMSQLAFAEKYARVYFLISAIEFFAISSSAIERFNGEEEFEAIKAAYPEELRAQVRRIFSTSADQ